MIYQTSSEVLVQYRWQGPSRKVLIVDDDPDIVALMAKVLGRDSSLTVLSTTHPEEAISLLREHEVAVLVCDQQMPDMDGIELLGLVRKEWPEIIAIMVTGSESLDVATEVVNRELVDYFVTKPLEVAKFQTLVQASVDEYSKRISPPEAEGD